MNLFTDNLNSKQVNFLSRIVGVFSEEIVRFWLENERCKYINIGRPQVSTSGDPKNYTLDFLLQNTKTKKYFIAEQKCFFGFKNGTLKKISEVETFTMEFEKWSTKKSISTIAWDRFINFDKDTSVVSNKQKKYSVSGKVLIWASYDKKAKENFQKKYKLSDVISFEHIIRDLKDWSDESYIKFIKEKQKWINELFKNFTTL